MTQLNNDDIRARRPGILAANAYFLLAGAGLVILELLAPLVLSLALRIFGQIGQTTALFCIDAAYYLPCILLPCVLLTRRHGLESMRLEPVPPGMGLMSVLAAAVCVPIVNAVAVIWAVLLESMGFSLADTQIVMGNTGELIMGVLALGAMPGVCEELLFRGVVLGGYERYGTRRAIVVSSLLFASLHGSVQGLPGQLLMGLVLGYVVCKSGSIYVGMMLHTTYNSILVAMAYVQNSLSADAALNDSMLEQVGGAAGLALVAAEGAVMLLILRAILRYFRRNAAAGSDYMPAKVAPGIGLCEKLILISGVITAIYLYISDIIYMLGYA